MAKKKFLNGNTITPNMAESQPAKEPPTQPKPAQSPDPISSTLNGRTLPLSQKGTSTPFDPLVLSHQLSLDRTGSTRIVPMKVLILGLSRTGTASLRHALFELGYFDVYHGTSFVNENPKDCDLWAEALRAKFENPDGKQKKWGREEFDQLLGHCMAVCDSPAYAFADDLILAYPDAKVILSIRDSAQAWQRSMCDTVVKTVQEIKASERGLMGVVSKVLGVFAPHTYYQPLFDLIFKHTHLLEIPERGVEMYEAHNAWIKTLVEDEDRLLVFNVKEGWEPLCGFLGKEVPEKAFPRVNDKESFLKAGAAFKKGMMIKTFRNMAIWMGIVLGLVGIGCWIWRCGCFVASDCALSFCDGMKLLNLVLDGKI